MCVCVSMCVSGAIWGCSPTKCFISSLIHCPFAQSLLGTSQSLSVRVSECLLYVIKFQLKSHFVILYCTSADVKEIWFILIIFLLFKARKKKRLFSDPLQMLFNLQISEWAFLCMCFTACIVKCNFEVTFCILQHCIQVAWYMTYNQQFRLELAVILGVANQVGKLTFTVQLLSLY